MNKMGFILSGTSTVLGVFSLIWISVIKNVLPLIGRAAYQSAAAGSYSPANYEADFGLATALSVIMILLGISMSVFLWIKEHKAA